MEVQFSFYSIAVAVVKLMILMSTGYVLCKFKVMDERVTNVISHIIVKVLFPSFIIYKTVSYFSFSDYPYWWFLPICAMVFSLAGMMMGWGAYYLLKPREAGKKVMMCGCGFQNAGYLPINLILFSFTGAVADRLMIYVFLFVIGFNILTWSFIPLFLSGKRGWKNSLEAMLNPPVIATVFSLLWVFFAGQGTMPRIMMDPLKQLGQASLPLAMLTLGAYLCIYEAYRPREKAPVIFCGVIKLVLFPLLVLCVLSVLPMDADRKFFLFLQSTMPTAVSMVVIGSYTGIKNEFFSSIIFYTHLVAIFSIPVWLGIFHAVMR